MIIWDVKSIVISRAPNHEEGWSKLDVLLRQGYEPFSVIPHIFKGDMIGEIVWLKKRISLNG